MRDSLGVRNFVVQKTYLKANSRTAAQGIPRLFWSRNALYCVHKIPPLVISRYLFKISFNIILFLCLRFSIHVFISRFLAEMFVVYISHFPCMLHAQSVKYLDLIFVIMFGDKNKLWGSWILSFLQPSITSPFCAPKILLYILFLGPWAYALLLIWKSKFNASIKQHGHL